MKIWLSLLMSFLIISNFLAIYFLDQPLDRWFRFGATFIFLVIYLLRYFSNYRLFVIFLLLAICDGMLIYYEIPVLRSIIYLLRILVYINMVYILLPALSKLKLNSFTISVSTFIIAIDLYLLHEMAESLPSGAQHTLSLILFYLLGLASLGLATTSLSYMNRYANRNAFFFVIVSFAFILSDLFYYIAYYLQFEEFYYLDRLVNIIGMGLLLVFSSKGKLVASKTKIS